MPHMRKSEDRGPSVKTAAGAFRLGLYAGGLMLRSLAGMDRKGEAYRQQPASCIELQNVYEVSSFSPISLFAGMRKERKD
ncbi:MAG: hypothetical protein C0508_00230 [Cyanobacteria bacterium PR.023]|nr:hypothetical protein [Cyanobacteria bacterium PR.023]